MNNIDINLFICCCVVAVLFIFLLVKIIQFIEAKNLYKYINEGDQYKLFIENTLVIIEIVFKCRKGDTDYIYFKQSFIDDEPTYKLLNKTNFYKKFGYYINEHKKTHFII